MSPKDAKKNSGARSRCACCPYEELCKILDTFSSEFSSSESITSSSELTSTSCISELSDCPECDAKFKNKKEEKMKEKEYINTKKKLPKRRNPSETSTKTTNKLESKKNSKEKTRKVPEKNKELLETTYSSDSSDDCDCNFYYTHCDCKQYRSKNKQKDSKNKCKKIISSKRVGKFTKTATTSKPLKCPKIPNKGARKSSEKERTSSFDPYSCNCNSRNTKCGGSSKCSKVSKKSTRNAKSLNNKRVSRKRAIGSSERHSSSFSSDSENTESYSSDEDSRDYCCGNIRQSYRKIKY